MKAAQPAEAPQSVLARRLRAVAYILLNFLAATGIVFANKLVLTVYGFHFVYALTLTHSLFTMVGMWGFAAVGIFTVKPLPARQVAPLAAAFVGYVVFWNLALQLNPVGMYQLAKILIAPAVLAIEACFYAKFPSRGELGAIAVLCAGVALATVSDLQVSSNPMGLLVAGLAVLTTSVYQIWVGAKQKQLQAGSMQLMEQYAPYASGLLALLVPLFEPVGLHPKHFKAAPPGAQAGLKAEDTLLGFPYTPLTVGAILLTAVLGLLVSWSTFLVIGATSSVTFNVVGHLKTIMVLAGGCVLFGEAMPPQRLAGVALAMTGIVVYSVLKMRQSKPVSSPAPSPQPASKGLRSLDSSAKPEEESLLPKQRAG